MIVHRIAIGATSHFWLRYFICVIHPTSLYIFIFLSPPPHPRLPSPYPLYLFPSLSRFFTEREEEVEEKMMNAYPTSDLHKVEKGESLAFRL